MAGHARFGSRDEPTMIDETMKAELEKPLDRANVSTREQGGKTLSYIEGWFGIQEANAIFGFDGWERETVFCDEVVRELVNVTKNGKTFKQWRASYVAKVRVTVQIADRRVAREGTGYGSGFGNENALGDAIEGAVKEAETDAMKRALMTWGNRFGLALYDKTQANVETMPSVAAEAAIAAINMATTLDDLHDCWRKNASAIKAFSRVDRDAVEKAKNDRKAQLETPTSEAAE